MFSDTEGHAPVVELCIKEDDGCESNLQIIESSGTDQIRATASAIPTPQNMMALARAVATMKWQRCGSIAHRYFPSSSGPPLRIARVIVRHRVIDFDGSANSHTAVDRAIYEWRPSP
jgi:hypothetical protein